MANIDRLVNVQIALNTTGISSNGFNTLMIVSAHEHAAPAYVLTITDADQLLDLGWNAEDAVYKAALQAFSQIPHYEKVKINHVSRRHAVGYTSVLQFMPRRLSRNRLHCASGGYKRLQQGY